MIEYGWFYQCCEYEISCILHNRFYKPPNEQIRGTYYADFCSGGHIYSAVSSIPDQYNRNFSKYFILSTRNNKLLTNTISSILVARL